MQAVERLLHLIVHTHQPQMNQGSNPFPSNLRRELPIWSTSGQQTAHSKTNCGAIPPLCGEIFPATGTKDPRYNNMGGINFGLVQQLAD